MNLYKKRKRKRKRKKKKKEGFKGNLGSPKIEIEYNNIYYLNIYYILKKMLIPVKCFTCGNVLANKYRWYEQEVRKRKMANNIQMDNVIYLTKAQTDKTAEGEVMDLLKLNKMCCRRHILTHVNIE